MVSQTSIFKETCSRLLDAHHFIHPKSVYEETKWHEPGLLRRIGGCALFALSLLPFGIPALCFGACAYFKAVRIEENHSEIVRAVESVFGVAVGSEGADELSEDEFSRITDFRFALEAIQYHNEVYLNTALKILNINPVLEERDDINKKIMDVFAKTAFKHDDVQGFGLLSRSSIYVPAYEVRSASMVEAVASLKWSEGSSLQLTLNIPNEEGNTALHLQHNNLEVVQTLLKYGASPSMQNLKGQIPLHLCQDPAVAKCMVNALFEQLPKGRFIGKFAQFDMEKAVAQILFVPTYVSGEGEEEGKLIFDVVPKAVTKAISDTFAEMAGGRTPLFYVGNKRQAEAMVTAGMDPNAKDARGWGVLNHRKPRDPLNNDDPIVQAFNYLREVMASKK